MGLLINNARTASRREIVECAEAIGVTSEQFAEFESGNSAPSLPQIELLALFFNLPPDHFWGKQVIPVDKTAQVLQDKEQLLMLCNRIISAKLRLARKNANVSLQEMAEKTGVAAERITQYESGELPIPATELELMSSVLDLSVDQFYDTHGPIGKWRSQQGSMQKFLDLPAKMQQFVTKPVNQPYLELAMRLSDLSAEKLRAVAEVLLEITY